MNAPVHASAGPISLNILRRIKASPAKVFAAWTVPEKLFPWFGPAGAVTRRAVTDLSVGGRYSITFQLPSGEMQTAFGTYLEIVPDQRLVFTWTWDRSPEWESIITIALRADGDGTVLSFRQEPFADQETHDSHNAGWSEALDRLAAEF